MLGNYLQQMTSAEDIFKCIFFLALRVKSFWFDKINVVLCIYQGFRGGTRISEKVIHLYKSVGVCFSDFI